MGNTTGNGAAVMMTPDVFLRNSVSKTSKVVSNVPYGGDNNRLSIRLPQAGLGHNLYVSLEGQIKITTSGSITGGTWKGLPNPAPFAAIKRCRFGNNNAINLRDFSGWNWYRYIRHRYGMDFTTHNNGVQFSSDWVSRLGSSATGRIVPGASITAGTYSLNMCLPLPISYNNAAENGLLVLQQNATFYDLILEFGQLFGGIGATGGSNDLIDGLTGTGIAVDTDNSYLKVTVGLEWYEPLANMGNMTNMLMLAYDQTYSPLIAGENTIKPPVNDYYTMMLFEAYNNGTQLTSSSISDVRFLHSGNVYLNQDDYITRGMMNYLQTGIPPMNGEIVYDFGLRRGMITRRDTLDAFNNQYVTDAQVKFNIPTSTSITGTNGVNAVYEVLFDTTQ